MSKRIAVVLCGCGRGDGSEIHESVSLLIHLSRIGASYKCFAPDSPQFEVINHATGKIVQGQTRNMLVEAARISRGDITPLDKLALPDFDALAFPGGFGAAKNLCNFALKASDCEVLPDVARIIREFHAAKKPIALACIAPVLAARVLGTRQNGPGVLVTIGSDEKTADAIRTMGSQHAGRGVTESCTDMKNKIITTPAYMFDATPYEVFTGIGKMVDDLALLLA
jgi:enhancing lycopene biosynthesis protein 2